MRTDNLLHAIKVTIYLQCTTHLNVEGVIDQIFQIVFQRHERLAIDSLLIFAY
jgi:hypothetical protein